MGVSTNWKLDVYKYKNYSYTQMVKRPRSMDLSTTPTMAISGASPKEGKCDQSKSTDHQRDKTMLHKYKNNTQTVTGLRRPQVNQRKGSYNHTHMDPPPQLKVSDPEHVIECTYRFHILQNGDGLVSDKFYDSEPTTLVRTENSPNSGPNVALGENKASQDDVSTRVIFKTGEKGKPKPESAKLNVKYQRCQLIQAQKPEKEVANSITTNKVGCYIDSELKQNGIICTKYDLDLHLKAKKSYKEFLPTCPTLQQWEANIKFKFGFIPLGDLKLSQAVSVKQTSLDPLQLHQKIKNSGESNYMLSQIMVKSQLNPDVWENLLQGYWDKQLPLMVRLGFPLDFDRRAQLVSHSDNHSSGKAYHTDNNAYLQE